MRQQVLGVVLGAGVALSGCASGWHAKPGGESYGKVGGERSVDLQRARDEACADWRWIGVKHSPATACPVPRRGWSVRQGFEPARRQRDCGDEQQPAPAGISVAAATEQLDRFCVYETAKLGRWSPRRPFESARAAGLAKLDRDCATIAPAWQEELDLTNPSWQDLERNFLAQAGQAPALDITKVGGARLAFLDTEATGELVPDHLERPAHGLTLANIARHLVCERDDLGTCAAKITTRLALPIVEFDGDDPQRTVIDTVNGGRIGTQQDLADAVYAEVNAWQAARTQQQHLVLNLSLGWDPTILGDLDAKGIAELQAGSEAVYSALQYAQAEGALVVAAAGNRRTCDSETAGPVLPAGWEQAPPSGTHSTVPLVYAVGALGWDNKPLSNARGMGMPKRVAYGEHAVVSAVNKPNSTWLYSGSSVATAVVSAAAALVWDSFPDLSRERVMDILYESGWETTDLAANFWFGGGGAAPVTKRVSVCRALASACASADGVPCPLNEKQGCLPRPDYQPRFPDWAENTVSPYCHPWVTQQPDDPHCPPCKPPEP